MEATVEADTGAEVEDPPQTETPESDKESTSEVDAGKAAATTDEPSKGEDEGQEAAGDEDEPEGWKNLVEKFDGDKDKIQQAFWRNNNEIARLAKELKDLKAKPDADRPTRTRVEPEPRATKAPSTAVEKPIEEHPAVVELETHISTLKGRIEALNQEGAERLTAIENQKERVAVLKHQVAEQGDLADEAIKTRLETAKERLQSLVEKHQDKGAERNSLRDQLAKAEGRREAVRGEALRERENQQKAAKEAQDFNESFPNEVDRLIVSASDEIGIPDKAEVREHLWNVVNAQMMVALWRLGKGYDVTEVEHEEMIHSFVEQYAKAHGYAKAKSFADTSRAKAAVSARTIKPGEPLKRAVAKAPVKPQVKPLQIGESGDPKLDAARRRLADKFPNL